MSTVQIPRLLDTPCLPPAPERSELPIEAAYRRVSGAIAAVSDEQLVTMNVDVPTAAGVVKAAALRLAPMRASLVDAIRHFDVSAFDQLADVADAVVYLHTELKRQDEPEDVTPALYEEALRYRERVVSVGRLLVKLQLIDTTAFQSAGSVLGYRSVGLELIGTCTTLLEKLPSLAGRCPLTEAQLLRGRTLGNMLLDAVNERGVDVERTSPMHKERLRAFSLMSHRYDELRRAVAFVRWHEEDAEALAPSWFAGRNAGRSVRGATPEAPREPAAADAPKTEAAPAKLAPPQADKPKGDPIFATPSDEPFVES